MCYDKTHPLMLVFICAKYPSRTVDAVEWTWQDVPYFISFITKSWLTDIKKYVSKIGFITVHGLNERHIAPYTDIEFQLIKYQTYINEILRQMVTTDIWRNYYTIDKDKQGKSEGFDSCDWPSNLTQIGFKSSIFQPCDLEI